MELDVIGKDAVLKLIEQSGHSKFNILRQGSTRTPIFDFSTGKDNNDALASFREWSNTMQLGNNSSAYDIILYTNGSGDEEEEVKGKKGRIKFSFALSKNTTGQINGYSGQNVNELIETAVSNAMAKRDAEEMRNKIAEMQETIDRLSEEDEEEDEESIGSVSDNDLLSKLTPIFSTLFGIKRNPEVSMAGVDENETKFSKEQIANFGKALRIMYKHNTELDKDLLKLAAISENNPGQFNMLINALRSM